MRRLIVPRGGSRAVCPARLHGAGKSWAPIRKAKSPSPTAVSPGDGRLSAHQLGDGRRRAAYGCAALKAHALGNEPGETPMNRTILSLAAALVLTGAARAAEFHVSTAGNDANPGTPAAPLRTIQHGADLAQPGDAITVHAGTYRERINPPRGGHSDTQRIVYQAAPGEKVEIKGSEVVKNWVKAQDDVWKVTLPNGLLRRLQPLQRPHPRRLVQWQGPPAPHGGRVSQRRVADRGRQAATSVTEARRHRRRCGSAEVDAGRHHDPGPNSRA